MCGLVKKLTYAHVNQVNMVDIIGSENSVFEREDE